MQVSKEVYELFADDRAEQANPEFYDGPANTPRPQLYSDYRIVYRSTPGLRKDPDQGKATELWPVPKNWRAVCAARRRWEL